jgi:hypothetical protein
LFSRARALSASEHLPSSTRNFLGFAAFVSAFFAISIPHAPTLPRRSANAPHPIKTRHIHISRMNIREALWNTVIKASA